MRMLSMSFASSMFLFFITTGSAVAGDNTYSGQAIKEGVQASGHASASAANSIAASGQVTSAAMAVPLSVGGAVLGSAGAASASAANQSMRAATAPIGTPLEVTDEAITITPPNEALKRNVSDKKDTNL